MDTKLNILPIIIISVLFLVIGLLLAPKIINTSEVPNQIINVEGNSKLDIMPDVAKMNLNIEYKKPTAEESMLLVKDKYDDLNNYVVDLNIPNLVLSTKNISVYPYYDYNKESEESYLKGYVASQNLVLEFKDYNNVRFFDILQDLSKKGILLNGMSFELSDDLKNSSYNLLLEQAIADARVKANNIAIYTLVKINKKPISINVNANFDSYPYYNYSYKALDSTYGGEEQSRITSNIVPEVQTISMVVDLGFQYE